KGYSQDYMGTQMNISQRAYCKLECGKTRLSIKRLRDVAEILELNPKKLL
ncbi:MAG TPA: XRE family transcriptional regulator, partial [Flavobacteriaceae bacterium]|nr:XRE family transcriptional regulator [Flavobacteriaceae bacterium]